MRRAGAVLAAIALVVLALGPAALGAAGPREGAVLFVPPSDFIRQPATDFTVPFAVANLASQGSGLTLEGAQLLGPDRTVLAEVQGRWALPGIAHLATSREALYELLADERQPADRREAARRAVAGGELLIPKAVDRLGLQVGDSVTLTVRATFTTPDGSPLTREAEITESYLMSLPAPSDYYAGDTHLHCNQFGDDGWRSIDAQAGEAEDRGLKWITMSPHAQKMASADWSSYKTACSSAGTNHSIAVAPSLETSTRHEYSHAWTSWGYRTPGGTQITSWTGTSDDGYYYTNIGFNFPFYGSTKTGVYVSTNGFLTFSSAGASSYSGEIPNTNTPNSVIAPFWCDLNPGSGGAVWVDKGVSNMLFVSWVNVPLWGTSCRQTFQARLDSQGNISFYYDTLNSPGSPTVGIEDDRGEYGATYTSALSSGLARKFTTADDSHYLAHDLDEFFTNPNPESRPGEDIVNAVKNNPYYGFGMIAHPYGSSYPWQYWTKKSGSTDTRVTGLGGLELMSGGVAYQAPSEALSKWDSLLQADLQDTIAGKGFVAGVSGSDDHDILWVSRLGRNLTWLHSTSTPDRSAVLSALRAGKVFASSDGSVTTFAATYQSTTYRVGEVVSVGSGADFTLSGTAYGADGNLLSGLDVYRNGSYVTSPSLNGGNWSYTASTTSDCYYRVVLATSDGQSYYTSYSNPIFFNVP